VKKLPFKKRTLALLAMIAPLLVLFVYVALRSGPLAPVAVVLAKVESKSISPGLFGIGTVEARYTYKIGPTYPGRVKKLSVDVGDLVKEGQVLGEMDPVDLDERISAQSAALKLAEARLRESQARMEYAQVQTVRYERLLKTHNTSEVEVAAKKLDLQVSQAGLIAMQEELSRIRAELKALEAQRRNLSLVAPVDALVVSRAVEPGTTVVAGQYVLELVDPESLWINVQFEQIQAKGLTADLPAEITLRSQTGRKFTGRVLRVEPLADAITEETLAKVVFDRIPEPKPPIGELAEVTVTLPPLAVSPVIPNAAIRRVDGRQGVWQVEEGRLVYTTISLGIADLEGHVQVREGLNAGDQVVVYSENALNRHKRIEVVDHVPGVAP